MSKCQFARCHAYSIKKVDGVLNEVDRTPGFISHVEKPEVPEWFIGARSAVVQAISSYMAKPAHIQYPKGRAGERKQRKDHRCLVAGTISWPDTVLTCRAATYSRESRELYMKWQDKLIEWLRKQFGSNLIAACAHMDESHPHIHFFVVGDAQRMHPGMKNELVNNKRIEVKADRYAAHKSGLKAWVDDFFSDVGQYCGLQRKIGSRPVWRIKDRAIRARLVEIDRALKERPDAVIQVLRDDIWDLTHKINRPRQVF